MAEDAVESAGAKAPAINISTQQNIAGEGVLMPDERCSAIHPTLGQQCERLARDCTGPGIDHTAQRADGAHELWPNEHGTTPMHKYFQELQQTNGNNEMDPVQRASTCLFMIEGKYDKYAYLEITKAIAQVIEEDRQDRECCKQSIKELREGVVQAAAGAVVRAVEEEREACAKLCEQTAERLQATTDHCMQWAATAFKHQAEIIRARSKD